MHTRCLQLNGLKVTLIHQPEASQSAALVSVAAGSHDEPDSWPGLAHLLEHLLFTGSQRWPNDGRLMSWVQACGGQVNASTQARQSAYFFEVAPENFSEGLLRLQDMLSAPRLTLEAIRQEIGVIDAEYRLLQHHAPARAEAAIFTPVTFPAVFQRFQTGNRAAFGDNVTELHAALQAFHQRFYHPENMALWLQGPQSLEALTGLAETFTAAFSPRPLQLRKRASITPQPVQLSPDRSLALQQEGPSALWQSWLLPAAFRDSVTLVREFLLDDAPGGLLATLHARSIATGLQVKWLYRSDTTDWLAITVASEQPAPVMALLNAFLQALSLTSTAQRQHYWQLAQQRLAAQSPLMQLQARALGFAAVGECPDISALLSELSTRAATTLFCTADAQAEKRLIQGYELALATWQVPAYRCPTVNWSFYPQQSPFPLSDAPTDVAVLPHIAPDTSPGTLVLRPELFTTLAAGPAYDHALRPVFAVLRHFAASGEWRDVQGVWQLRLQLPSDKTLLSAALAQLLQRLSQPARASSPHIPGIAIRELLRQLPYQLATSVEPAGWRAVLLGGDADQQRIVAQQLSVLKVNSPTRPSPASVAGETCIPQATDDSAVLLFIPLDDGQQLAALRALALICEPRFYQRYRVEQPVGYVVSCRYHRSVDTDGLLFGLQSPDCPASTLIQFCEAFLHDMTPGVAQCDINPIKTQLMGMKEDPEVAALRQANGLTNLEPEKVASLTQEAVQQLHQRLLTCRHRWRILYTKGKN
ncbi:pyrroloquinoline quinone biosynthesis protein PqqF [Pantoea sp. OXWO6B1]|uniref:pyrroloquinoline quinone biosynthesis protein PqqF n=1 Tax=Pantoea sp. OXWO6B1 TaxID=1835724 RepID=UPI0007C6E92D|nr:pyrroloquinoline quinone biosynthesis protein PqqF [Pantoea sp. OXWO6B1]OAE08511.1 coenzyme PQQ biosynthesis protein PqqF [Pantoea sp. OXWO6B1]